MLSILASWCYIGCMVFILGCAFLQMFDGLAEKAGGYERDSLALPLGYVGFCGVMVTTYYAQVFSLFFKLGGLANVLLAAICLLYLIVNHDYVGKVLKKSRGSGWILLAVFIFAACSAGPAKLIDTDWYHAQTIRWLEEFGCVKGVANLFYALGFNNAQHYFDALFSMKWLFHQSMRVSGGFFGLLIFIHGFSRVKDWKKHQSHIADGIAIGELLYSIIVTAFYADPYVDTLPNGLVLFIYTEWFSCLEDYKQSKRTLKWQSFYCILAVFALICKTSIAPVILLTVIPAVQLIQKKRWKEIVVYISMGIALLIPFFATNIITTGYPVYLLSALDLCPVPWKVDGSVLQYSIDNMVAFARMPLLPMEEVLQMGMRWIPDWFMRESISHKILYVGVFLLVMFDGIQILYHFIRGKKEKMATLWPRICGYIGLIYWFFTIPQVKYCWAFLILPLAVIPAVYSVNGQCKRRGILRSIQFLSAMIFLMYLGFYAIRTVSYSCQGVKNHFVMQQDYENHHFNQVEKNGHVFYTRIDGGDIVCGYYIFPYLDNKETLNRLHVGDELGEGFYFEE